MISRINKKNKICLGAKLKQYNIWGVLTFKQANILITFILFKKTKNKKQNEEVIIYKQEKTKVWKREYEERKGGAGDRFITRQLFMHTKGMLLFPRNKVPNPRPFTFTVGVGHVL